jgi:hypothetical protein
LRELIRVAGARWSIEECFQTAKNEAGLDQYQVRDYRAWYAHITLSMLAAAYLAATSPSGRRPRPLPQVREAAAGFGHLPAASADPHPLRCTSTEGRTSSDVMVDS